MPHKLPFSQDQLRFQVEWERPLVDQAHLVVLKTYEECLVGLRDRLNERHEINWGTERYRKLLGYWLLSFVQIIYDRLAGVRQSSSGMFDVVDSPFSRTQFGYLPIFNRCEDLNNELYREISFFLAESKLPRVHLPKTVSCVQGFRNLVSRATPVHIHRPYFFLHGSTMQALMRQIQPYWRLRRVASPLRIHECSAKKIDLDNEWRLSSESNSNSSSDLVRICTALARVHLPAEYVEGFAALRRSAKKQKPRALYTAISVFDHIPFCFLAAEHHGVGRLFCHQHGGGFGLEDFNFSEHLQRSISENFYTWGWSEDAVTRPLPWPPRVYPLLNGKAHGILLKLSNFSRYVFRIGRQPMGLQNQRLIDQTIRLVRGIDSLELEISFAADLGWDIRQRFVEAGLGILEKQRRDQTYALHVSNFPATAWLETLAANIPTVCLFDPQVTVFRNASLGRIEALERVGILHQSPESAADWIRKVYDCPEIWWETDEVQEARSAFVSRYARLENCWEERWSEEFRRISSAQN